MPKGKMFVYSNPSTPEREAEFNEWYSSVHVPDVLKIPGITAATRYKLADSPAGDAPGKYLAVYDVEADDFNDILAGLGKAFADGSMPISDCIAPGPMVFFEPV